MKKQDPEKLLIQITSELLGLKADRYSYSDIIKKGIYSTAAIHALNSLNDSIDTEKGITVEHFKIKIKKIVRAFCLDLERQYHPFRIILDSNLNESSIEDVLFEIYEKNGYFFKSKGRLFQPLRKEVQVNDLLFIRGDISYTNDIMFSGAGPYRLLSRKTKQAFSNLNELRKMFNIPDFSIQDNYEQIVKAAHFTDENKISLWDTEYLNLTEDPLSPPFIKIDLTSDNQISLLRTNSVQNSSFFLYRKYNNVIEISDLDLNNYSIKDYRRLAWGILEHEGISIPISYSYKNELVRIQLKFLLPHPEQYFFMLYSWSDDNSILDREMKSEVFSVFRKMLSEIGYKFIEK